MLAHGLAVSICEGRQYISPLRAHKQLVDNGVGKVKLEDVVEQLVELQSQLAFHEDTVASLNEVMASQQQEILLLRQQLTLLKQRQEETQAQLEQGGPPAAMEKPPHY